MDNTTQPYVFAISDHEIVRFSGHHAMIAQRLSNGGFDVGLMLWTANPRDYTIDEIQSFWKDAFERAGIKRMDWGYDCEKQRTWYKVWRKTQ